MKKLYIFCIFIIFINSAAAESLSVSTLVINSKKENDNTLLSLAYKRCAGLNIFLNVKFTQTNLTEIASAKQVAADLFSAMAANLDVIDEQSRNIKSTFKTIKERQDSLKQGSISRIVLFYANKSNENYVRNGSIINGDLVLESDFEMCNTILAEAVKVFK